MGLMGQSLNDQKDIRLFSDNVLRPAVSLRQNCLLVLVVERLQLGERIQDLIN